MIHAFKLVFWLLWRSWFVLWAALVTIILFPAFFILLLKDSWYPLFFKVGKVWAFLLLFGMGFSAIKQGTYEYPKRKNYIYIANHTSVLDIMMMILLCKKPIVFVGKKELAKIPVFGFLYKKTCVLVDRSSHSSRKAVFDGVNKKIEEGKSICIFPEGLVPDDESVVLSPFKVGAFKMAEDHQIDIAPVVFYNMKKHFSFTFFSGSPGILKYEKIPIISYSKYKEIKDLTKYAEAQFRSKLE
ncbi:MAG: lysophospholipid acyltransferase family protein [Flavobacteriaceae bacterium]